MGSDNVDIFKKVIFSIPSLPKIILGIVFLGLVYGFLTFLGVKAFTSHQIEPVLIVNLAVLVFIVPTLVMGEVLHLLIEDYPRTWGYFLSWCNQLILFIFSVIMTGANNFGNAWSIFWIALISLYLSSFVVLLLTLGFSYVKKISLLSMIQPGLILIVFYLTLGKFLKIPLNSYLINIGMALVVGVSMIIFFFVIEILIGANVKDISIVNLTASFLQKKQEKLGVGYSTRPDVQTLMLENETEKAKISIPWIHPGPLEGFGGGRITSKIINSLNTAEQQGFFLHVPSTHKSDPSNPKSYEKIIDAMDKPGTVGKASKLVTEDYGEIKFHGRKLDDKKIIFIDTTESGTRYDDYEMSVFREVIDTENTILVDLHNHEREIIGEREVVWYNTDTSSQFRAYLQDFIDKIEGNEVYNYSCGFNTLTEDTKIFSLAEEVNGQRTLMVGIEGNEKGKELEKIENKYKNEFDKVLSFTTDTHRSIHEMSREKQVESERLIESVEEAKDNFSKGFIGFSNQKAQSMKLLQEDYYGMIYSINIIVRLVPLVLLLFYIGLIFWIW